MYYEGGITKVACFILLFCVSFVSCALLGLGLFVVESVIGALR